ncbi:RNA methyltransferase, TrmH family [Nonlabens sp. Hel1_33_55]|uniref:TrmH family RNA methyltransferase n=1 Tax=Nonlabens sp. Hel1_33_55 TaxID=1336802 RepID=UPI000875ECA3|nr:TrmH family RNA methyltransferase [Nonlabens sp. Hel1_33_55]SCY05215.1 RNA methyltransferase, TrmH family [Nonlabens sp. Hel1_33_55]
MKYISSPHNAVIRHAEQLQRKSKTRRKEGLFLIEGKREIGLAIAGGFKLEKILVCGDIFYGGNEFTREQVVSDLGLNGDEELVAVSIEVYEKLAYRSGTEGCIAFAKAKKTTITDLLLSANPLILIAESPEKPGNVGALLRTADAAGIDAVIIVDPISDLFNPNVIRSSVGCIFTVPTATATAAECVSFLKSKSIDLYAATLQTSERYDLIDFKKSTAIAVGTEATGLSQTLRDTATANIIIPMSGAIDSMNVSVSAAILLFEAKRQRGF